MPSRRHRILDVAGSSIDLDVDDRHGRAEREFDDVSGASRAIAFPAVPDGDQDVRSSDDRLADEDVGAFVRGTVAGQSEPSIGGREFRLELVSLLALREVGAVIVRCERKKGADLVIAASGTLRRQLVRAGRKRRVKAQFNPPGSKIAASAS